MEAQRNKSEQDPTCQEASLYISDMEAIKKDIFDCRKPEHVASYKKSLKQVTDCIRHKGDKESVLVVDGLESFDMQSTYHHCHQESKTQATWRQ